MYRSLYDDKHRFRELSRSRPGTHRYDQKGIREKLLCHNCEAQLSAHERYADLLFSGRIPVRSSAHGSFVHIHGIDYKQFRLFGLSILWRAGVSTQPMFSRVHLRNHAETLRRMLMHGDPGHAYQYGFLLSPLLWDRAAVNDLILQPTPARIDGMCCYRFVFGGLIWLFTVSQHRSQTPLRDAFVNPSGQMTMYISELNDVQFITNGLRDMVGN